MPFQKGHKLRMIGEQPLDRQPLTLKLRAGLLTEIKQIPDWQNKVRDLLETWVKEADP